MVRCRRAGHAGHGARCGLDRRRNFHIECHHQNGEILANCLWRIMESEMMKQITLMSGTAMLIGFHSLALIGSSKESAPPSRFAIAKVCFEQNATDGDVEAVFEAMGGSEGLAKFMVVAPDGRVV